MFWAGSKQGRVTWIPRSIAYQYACAGLFTGREDAWSQAAYLVKHEGSTAWCEVPREVVSPMPVAGYRQRVDRIMTEVRRSRINRGIYPMIAAHVASRYAQAFPCQPPVAEVRLVNSSWRTNEFVMTNPVGRWRLPPGDVIDKSHVTTVSVFRREAGLWRDVTVRKQGTTPTTTKAPVNTLPTRPMASGGTIGTRKTSGLLINPSPIKPGAPLSKRMRLPPLPKGSGPQPATPPVKP